MIAAPPKTLPLTETYAPAAQADLAETVRAAGASKTPIYPLGGGTALGYGLAGKTPGWGLATTSLNKVVDYPARDLTITVEAGITVGELQRLLAAENQFLPIDVPQSEVATLGGAIAVNMSGPRRFGHGTLRDYVIGISAVDGRGTSFSAGGRVVKNVAGYDFCKLLVGSLGTLAVMTQVTLKVKPLPAAAAWLVVETASLEQAEDVLAAVAASRTTPVAVELPAGRRWSEAAELPAFTAAGQGALVAVGLEGTDAEVRWMLSTLEAELAPLRPARMQAVCEPSAYAALLARLTAFGCDDTGRQALTLKCNVRPSRVVEFASRVRASLPEASLLAHAADGILLVRLPDDATIHDVAKPLLQTLQPLAAQAGGQCVVWNTPAPEELTRATCWGPARESDEVLRRVKQVFDPHGLLNPGRFLY